MQSDNIIFFYPSKLIGGAEYLFARLADYLARFCNKNVYYIDYKDGFIRANEQFKDLNFIDFSDDIKTELAIGGVLVTPISNIYRLDDFIDFKNPDLRLFFWTLHACNLIHVMPDCSFLEKLNANFNGFFIKHFLKNSYKVFCELLKKCDKYNALCHMDYMVYSYNKMIFPELKVNYLPIASIEKNKYCNGQIINKDEVNIAILGRLCVEKTMPIINLLNSLNKLKLAKIIKVHIIGEGECKSLIKPKKYKNINIIFKGSIIGEHLDDYLINNADILFSMGTSCLEGAALRLPVAVLPCSCSKFNFEKYYFLYESKFYNVGNWLNDYKENANITLKELIELVYMPGQKEKIGLLNYQYFCKHHSVKSVANRFLECLQNDSLSYFEYSRIKNGIPKLKKNRNLFYKIFKEVIKYAKR